MSEATLLIFGCAVTFIAVAGAYLVIRESYTRESTSRVVPATANQRQGRGPRPIRRDHAA